jgi:hypothetical protein
VEIALLTHLESKIEIATPTGCDGDFSEFGILNIFPLSAKAGVGVASEGFGEVQKTIIHYIYDAEPVGRSRTRANC